MACGGSGDDNPFSFKNYMKSKGPLDKGSSDNETEDIFDLPDDVPNEPKAKQQEPAREENPFSFKKFLSKDATSRPGTRPKSTSSQSSTASVGSRTIHITDAELAAANASTDFASDLPDFVQDHFNTVDSPRSRNVPRHMGLPDFAPDSGGPLFQPPSPDDFSFNLDHPFANNDNEVEASMPYNDVPVSDSNGYVPSMQGGLPDFISDSNIGDHGQSNSNITANGGASRHVDVKGAGGDVHETLQRLRRENEQLQQEVNEAHSMAEVEAQRVAKVLRDMEAIQARESEETSALEKMVQQVEANLETSTARAAKAESLNAKLKQEIKSLKLQITSLQQDNKALRSGDTQQASVREKTQHASQQLAAAADAAQQHLQSLLSGVDNLRMLSKVLESVDKVTDAESPSGENPD